MANYLVTGGCGFIGSHLVDLLKSSGHNITVIDDLSSGKRENIPVDVNFIQGCITDTNLITQCFDNIDGCFHLAAIASVQKSVEDWVGTHRVNLTGTINILNAARKKNTPVLFISSAAIYGNNTKLPLKETEVPAPLTAYGADKLGCEQHATIASKVYNVPTLGFRLFNIYGPRQDPNSPYSGVISIFMEKIRQKQPITFYGDGFQTRDFVFVSDVVKILAEGMKKLRDNKLSGTVLNVASGKAVSIKDLANQIAACAHQPLESVQAEARTGDIRQSCGSTDALRKALGIVPPTSLGIGLKETYAFFCEQKVSDAAGEPPRQSCAM